MNITTIVSEAIKNIVSGAGKAGLAGAMLLIVVSLGIVDGLELSRTFTQLTQGRQNLSYAIEVRGIVSPSECASIAQLDRIPRAGAIGTKNESLPIQELGGSSIAHIVATPGARDFFNFETNQPTPTSGVFISKGLSEQLGNRSSLTAGNVTLPIAGIVQPKADGLIERSNYIIELNEHSGSFGRCIIDRWPSYDNDANAFGAVAQTGGADVEIIRVNNDATSDSPRAQLSTRPTRTWTLWSSIIGATIVAVLWNSLRRRDHALLLQTGVPRTQLTATMLTEALLVGTAVCMLIAAPIVLTATRNGHSLHESNYIVTHLAQRTALSTLIFVLSSLVATALTRRRQVLKYLRD